MKCRDRVRAACANAVRGLLRRARPPQDCCAHVRWFKEAGIPVKVICDPNQAIYGFRGGVTRELNRFADTFDDKEKLPVTGNFRSSRHIARGIRESGQIRPAPNAQSPARSRATASGKADPVKAAATHTSGSCRLVRCQMVARCPQRHLPEYAGIHRRRCKAARQPQGCCSCISRLE